MRILQVIDTVGPGGAEDVMLELSRACVRASHECFTLVPGPGWLSEALRARGIPVEIANPSGAFSLGYLAAIVRATRRHRVDVIHAHLFGAGLYAALAGRLAGVPVVVTLHGATDLPPTERYLSVKSRILRGVDRMVAVSPQLRDYLLQRLPHAPPRLEVIPNGIDSERFLRATALDLRQRLGLPVGALLIGSVGNIRAAKAYEIGLRALGSLRRGGLDAHWCIAGQADPSGELITALRKEADTLGIGSAVHFLGFLDEPERFLAGLDCYLLCSRSEGHPLSLCQAMTAGRAVVATACGVEAFLHDGTEGWLVPVDDPDRLAEALRDALSDAHEALRRGALARARAVAEFDSRASFDRYFGLYRDLIG